jgi:transcriptional regulator with XRE-family HTH domain
MDQDVLIATARGWIALLLERRGVSRAALARRIGKSKAYVTQLLRAPRNITLRTLATLAWALGCRVRLALVRRRRPRRRFRSK